jgi:hypothetical protein
MRVWVRPVLNGLPSSADWLSEPAATPFTRISIEVSALSAADSKIEYLMGSWPSVRLSLLLGDRSFGPSPEDRLLGVGKLFEQIGGFGGSIMPGKLGLDRSGPGPKAGLTQNRKDGVT